MNERTLRPASASLAPTARMLPPAGCRGAVSAWPQLVRAIGNLASNPITSAQMTTHGGSPTGLQFGSPAALMAALALHPAILQTTQPPKDVYAHFIWFTTKVMFAARTMGATLAQLGGLVTSASGSAREEMGTLVSELITGTGGLKQTADSIAGIADDFVQRLGETEGWLGLDQALTNFKTAGANLEQDASAAAGAKARDLAQFQSAAANAAQRVRIDLNELEFSAATVTAASVIANLSAVMRLMASEWRVVGAGLALVVSDATTEQLGDPGYLREALDLDRAVAEWNSFADAVKAFIQRSLIAQT